MPKLGKNYRINLQIPVSQDLKDRVIALSWVKGYKGRKSPFVRDVMIKLVERMIRVLTPEEKREFDHILLTVKMGQVSQFDPLPGETTDSEEESALAVETEIDPII